MVERPTAGLFSPECLCDCFHCLSLTERVPPQTPVALLGQPQALGKRKTMSSLMPGLQIFNRLALVAS